VAEREEIKMTDKVITSCIIAYNDRHESMLVYPSNRKLVAIQVKNLPDWAETILIGMNGPFEILSKQLSPEEIEEKSKETELDWKDARRTNDHR